jgi:hypothetical protein
MQYNISISAISFAQTISVDSYSVKTIHQKNLFDQVVIDKLNPATFELTFPAIRETDFVVLFNRALDYLPFDLYVTTYQDVFKIANCIITNTSFITVPEAPLSFRISGEASLLTREGDFGVVSVPGTVVPRAYTTTFNVPRYAQVVLNSIAYDPIVSSSIELQNDLKWLPYTTLGNSCISNGVPLSYPQEYVVDKQILAGSFSIYALQDMSFSKGVPLFIRIGQVAANIFYGFEFDLDLVSYTTRINSSEIMSQSFDWRLVPPVDSLYQVIKYRTSTSGPLEALLDENDQPILDENNEPIYVMI